MWLNSWSLRPNAEIAGELALLFSPQSWVEMSDIKIGQFLHRMHCPPKRFLIDPFPEVFHIPCLIRFLAGVEDFACRSAHYKLRSKMPSIAFE